MTVIIKDQIRRQFKILYDNWLITGNSKFVDKMKELLD